MKSRLVQSDLRIMPNGDTVAAYFGKVETKGIEWTTGGRFEWNKGFFTGNFAHKFLTGIDFQYNANTGEGVKFDTLFSYYGPDAGRRPYGYSDIPGQLLASLYTEDKITGHLLFDFNLTLGARYETYRPYKFNLSGLWGNGDIINSHQGTFFNPRVNLMVYLSNVGQLRLSAGRSSKSPAMSLIYPPESVFRWRNPIENKIIYLRYDLTSPELKGYQENQFEVSYDKQLFKAMGITISAYYKQRTDETRNVNIPVFFDNSDNKVYYIDSYSLPENTGWTISKGLEFTIRTNKIKPLNMNFKITGSYSYFNSSTNGYSLDMTPDSTKGQFANYSANDSLIAFKYPTSGKWNDRFQLNYYIKYTLPPLGLWVTLRAEQLVMERNQSYNLEPQDFNLLTESGKVNYLFNRAMKVKNVKWLFNINISKSLFKGAEVSFYVNNVLDDPAIRQFVSSPGIIAEEVRNPSLFYGIEFSAIVDDLF